MKCKVVYENTYQNDIDRLQKKYPHVTEDVEKTLNKVGEVLTETPEKIAYPIPSCRKKLWKLRIPSSDMKRGKSGGFRLIFYHDRSKARTINLIQIFPKTEREDLSSDDYQILLRKFVDIYSK